MKKLIVFGTVILGIVVLCNFVGLGDVIAQTDSTASTETDSTNDVYDWITRILAAIGILVSGYDAYKAKARDRAARAQKLFTTFISMVDNNDFSAVRLKQLANEGRDVVKKDGPSTTTE